MTGSSLGSLLGHLRTLIAAPANAPPVTDRELLHAFADRQDQEAFTVLVRRHGPMVLRVCRRVLQHQQDAEDAFQATFLVLARKAASLHGLHALAGWLHGTAYRMALAARRAAARRRYHEGRAPATPPRTPTPDLAWWELQTLLEEEIQRLPEAYRMAFVLCCQEGKRRAEAARLLGVKVGTISSRLDQARKRLQRRLARRGISLSAVLAALALSDPVPVAAQPATLFAATARAAAALAAGRGPAASVVTAAVEALVRRGTRPLFAGQIPVAPLFLAVALAATGAGLVACSLAAPGPAEEPPPLPAAPGAVAPPQLVRTDADGEPLPEGALARLGTLRFRAGGFISTLRFTPDGTGLTAGVTNGSVCLFDVASGRALRRTPLGEPARRPGSISDDGRWAVIDPERRHGAIDPEATLEVRDCATGQKVRELGKAPYLSGLFALDGQTLAALRYDRVVEIWDPHAGRLLRSWKTDDAASYDLYFQARFTAGGKVLVTSNARPPSRMVVRCWDVATGAPLHEFRGVHTNTLFAASAQGVLAVDGTDYTAANQPAGEFTEARVRLFDVRTGKEIGPLVARQKKNVLGQPSWFMAGEFSPDGKLLATGGQEGLIRLWDVAAGRELRSWPYVPSKPGALRFSADGRLLAVCDHGQTVRLLDVTTGVERDSPEGHRSGFFQTAFTPDGSSVLTLATTDAVLHVWDARTGRCRWRREFPRAEMAAATLSRDGARVFSWANDHRVRTWDAATGKEVGRWPDNVGSPYFWALVPSPDGKTLALLFQSPTVYLLDAATGKELRRLEAHSPYPHGVAFLPDGRSLVTWGGDSCARVWDLATGRELRPIAFTDNADPRQPVPPGPAVPGAGLAIFSTAVSPDGRLLAFGSRHGFIVVHDLASGKRVRHIDGLPAGVARMTFAPDGRTLAWSAEADPVVRVLEVASGRERHQLRGHLGSVHGLAFSPDGRRLASASEDTTALVWDLAALLPAGTPAEREAAWADLAGDDAARAYRAVRRLAAAPAFLADRVRPVAVPDGAHLARLITELGADDFGTRQKAATELERLGETAAAACRKALTERPSAEVRRRLEVLLDRQLQASWAMTPERLRADRALEALELSGTPEARRILEPLARGAAGARLTDEARAALQRLSQRPPNSGADPLTGPE